MSKKKKIGIVGAGPGGLTAGVILANRGFDVTIFERKSNVGGRNASIKLGDYTFDTGPTFLMLSYILEDIFKDINENINEHLKLINLEPMYRLNFFNGLDIHMSSDHEKMNQIIIEKFKENGFFDYLKNEEKRFKYLKPCFEKPYLHFWDMLKNPLIKALPYLDIGKSLWSFLSKYFKDENLRLCFTFQSKYLGMSAWECPAAFSMIAYSEHKYKIFHVTGGLNKISQAMAKIFENKGGRIILNAEVLKLVNDGRKIKGVKLKNGEFYSFDDVIVNADFSYAVTNLMDPLYVKKYSPQKLKKKKYSCSTFMIYLGLKKKYNLPHHNIFFAEDYKKNIDDIFKNMKISDQISFYLQNASVTDNTLAPENKSTFYILAPVPNLKSDNDWEKEKESFRKRLLNEVIKRTGIKDLIDNIEVEHIITPKDWERDYNVYYGATFNLGHNLSQMLYFRPRNKFECFDNLYLVGGGTHPGSGLPTIYESGRIASNLITAKYKSTK